MYIRNQPYSTLIKLYLKFKTYYYQKQLKQNKTKHNKVVQSVIDLAGHLFRFACTISTQNGGTYIIDVYVPILLYT